MKTLTVAEIARKKGCTPQTVYDLARKAGLAAVNMPGVCRFSASDAAKIKPRRVGRPRKVLDSARKGR